MIDPDHPTPRVGHPEVAARVVSQAVRVVDALTNRQRESRALPCSGPTALRLARSRRSRGTCRLGRYRARRPLGRVPRSRCGRPGTKRRTTPLWTSETYSCPVLSSASEVISPSRARRAGPPSPPIPALPLPATRTRRLTLRVVPQHLMTPGVGDEDAAFVVDEQAVRHSEARRLCARQSDRNENERGKEECSTHRRNNASSSLI